MSPVCKILTSHSGITIHVQFPIPWSLNHGLLHHSGVILWVRKLKISQLTHYKDPVDIVHYWAVHCSRFLVVKSISEDYSDIQDLQ